MNRLLIIVFAVSMMALAGCSKDLDYAQPLVMNYKIQAVQIVSGDVASFCAGTGTLALRFSGKQQSYTNANQTSPVERDFATDPSISEPAEQGNLHLEPCAYFPSKFQQYDSYGQSYPNIVEMDSQCRIKLNPSNPVHSVGNVTMSMKGEITHARMQPSYKGFQIDCP